MIVETMPKEVVSLLVREMTETKGWEIVEEYINKEIEVCTEKLKKNKFTELYQVLILQGRIELLNQLKLRINTYIK